MLGIESEIKVQTYPSILETQGLSIVPLLSGDGDPRQQFIIGRKGSGEAPQSREAVGLWKDLAHVSL